ncbi:hypothetical protein PR048_008647 [Dryococelus australis]|uniref:Uncharacterized protein n=1 Tax=Dryococelus australis TaxID=614101 RepID=A0ABQ9HXP6_9NEOP|nr:hypothetical protein PR048_008647 [Dryococelus australis]
MYILYVECCEKEQRLPVDESCYRSVFNTQYNFGFHPSRKDTCKSCDIFNIKMSNPDLTDEEKRRIETDHTLHLCRAEKALKSMSDDKEAA